MTACSPSNMPTCSASPSTSRRSPWSHRHSRPARPHRSRPSRRNANSCEIRFPRVAGYRVELPEERLQASFTADATLVLTPDLVGPSVTRNEGIIGEGVDLNLVHTGDLRRSTLLFHLTKRLLARSIHGVFDFWWVD